MIEPVRKKCTNRLIQYINERHVMECETQTPKGAVVIIIFFLYLRVQHKKLAAAQHYDFLIWLK